MVTPMMKLLGARTSGAASAAAEVRVMSEALIWSLPVMPLSERPVKVSSEEPPNAIDPGMIVVT